MTSKDKKTFSIIVPVYNDELYVEECVYSILNQTFYDFELIIVDDGSNDSSVHRIRRIVGDDKRVRLHVKQKNEGAYQARKTGVAEASGKYILFVDADDTIDIGLLEELSTFVIENDYDIFHFNSNIVGAGASGNLVEHMKGFSLPLMQMLYNNDIFAKCFLNEEYGFNIWNKLFKTDICKEAFDTKDTLDIPKANDLYIYFVIAANAHTYIGINTSNKYNYYFGRGNTAEHGISATEYERYCKYPKLQMYLEEKPYKSISYEEKQSALSKIKLRLLRESVGALVDSVASEDGSKAVKMLFDTWGTTDVLTEIGRDFLHRKNIIAEYIAAANLLKKNNNKTKSIAIFYYRYRMGGVERVISLLIPIFLQLGLKVTLITEEEEQTSDYVLPNGVRRYVLPRHEDIISGKTFYNIRGAAFDDIIKEEQIDTISYHAATEDILLLDLICIKSFGCKFLLSRHEVFSQLMVVNRDILTEQIAIYPLVDRMIVLSEEEKAFWQSLGVSSVCVPNPIHKLSDTQVMDSHKRQDIVWIGRLENTQKQYKYIVPIMEQVARENSNVKLRIYGSPEHNIDLTILKRQIKGSNLEHNVIYEGYFTDVERLYENARAILITSAYESFSMVILEAKQFGVPIVNFDMPYLELLKDKKGNIPVRQGDVYGAASALLKILNDDKLHERLSCEARQSFENFSKIDLVNIWNEILMSENNYVPSLNNIYANIFKTMVFHQSMGCDRYDELERKYRTCYEKYRASLASDIARKSGKRIALFPYGRVGKRIDKIFDEGDFRVELRIDNGASDHDGIIKLSDFIQMNVSDFLLVICTKNTAFYEEIRESIKGYVPKENIFDFFEFDIDGGAI